MKEAWIILIGYSGKGLLLVLTQDLAKTIQVENWKGLQINFFVVVDVVFLFCFFFSISWNKNTIVTPFKSVTRPLFQRRRWITDWRRMPICKVNGQTKFLFSGNGSYIYIETSLPRRYHERAKLYSPWMRGNQRLTFFYSMYGSAVETLSIYVRDQAGKEFRVWSRHGGKLSSSWTEGCATLNYTGSYQVARQISVNTLYHALWEKYPWRSKIIYFWSAVACYLTIPFIVTYEPQFLLYHFVTNHSYKHQEI